MTSITSAQAILIVTGFSLLVLVGLGLVSMLADWLERRRK